MQPRAARSRRGARGPPLPRPRPRPAPPGPHLGLLTGLPEAPGHAVAGSLTSSRDDGGGGGHVVPGTRTQGAWRESGCPPSARERCAAPRAPGPGPRAPLSASYPPRPQCRLRDSPPYPSQTHRAKAERSADTSERGRAGAWLTSPGALRQRRESLPRGPPRCRCHLPPTRPAPGRSSPPSGG